jgi:hypothetical protein
VRRNVRSLLTQLLGLFYIYARSLCVKPAARASTCQCPHVALPFARFCVKARCFFLFIIYESHAYYHLIYLFNYHFIYLFYT